MDLGAPIGGGGGGQIGQRNTVPSDGFDQGEHGAGIGLSGGVSETPNPQVHRLMFSTSFSFFLSRHLDHRLLHPAHKTLSLEGWLLREGMIILVVVVVLAGVSTLQVVRPIVLLVDIC